MLQLSFDSDELNEATLAARQKLISLKSKISSYAGKPTDTTVPAFLTALQQHLEKATAGPSIAYKNITLGQCVLAEKNLKGLSFYLFLYIPDKFVKTLISDKKLQ